MYIYMVHSFWPVPFAIACQKYIQRIHKVFAQIYISLKTWNEFKHCQLNWVHLLNFNVYDATMLFYFYYIHSLSHSLNRCLSSSHILILRFELFVSSLISLDWIASTFGQTWSNQNKVSQIFCMKNTNTNLIKLTLQLNVNQHFNQVLADDYYYYYYYIKHDCFIQIDVHYITFRTYRTMKTTTTNI